MPGALLFDLDETLVLEEPAAVAAFEATARAVPGVEAARLAVDARDHARALWYAAPTHAYCRRIGISSWEGLWCRFEDVPPALAALAGRPLAVVTNGAACLQREKLAASGLEDRFDAVIVSGELGVGKPDASAFRHALEQLGAEDGVMIGDSLDRDVDGALAAGLGAVWINRFGDGPGRAGVAEVSSLAGLSGVLRQ